MLFMEQAALQLYPFFMINSRITIVLLIAIVIPAICQGPSQQPVIGVYTQKTENFNGTQPSPMSSYIAASYIKNLQMAGAQVVPIFYHSTEKQLDDMLGKINGVFFPGGAMPIDIINQWTRNIAYIVQYATKKNNEGHIYPIWATCLGYEAVMYVTSGKADNMTVLSNVDGQDGKTCQLIVKRRDSKLLNLLSSEEYNDVVSDDGLFYFHHKRAILLDTFLQNTELTRQWNLISTSKLQNGTQFVTTIQSKNYPFYLTQYHPEKNSFEWRVAAKRTYNAISIQQKFINLFVNQARKNKNVFPLQELNKKLIYNYQPVLTPLKYAFVQLYLFDESNISIE